MSLENFTPLWKEKDSVNPQYKYENGDWVKTSEKVIDSLWHEWVVHDKAHRYTNEEGFSIYGLLNE